MSASSFPLFGRAWDLQVLSADGSTLLDISTNTFEPEALRITFDIWMPCFQDHWEADISIYNVDPRLLKLITQGAMVSLTAGYQSGIAAEIWRGPVFQPFYEREDVVDFKLTLHCISGFYQKRFFAMTHGPIGTQWQIVQNMCANAVPTPIPIGHLDPESSFTSQRLVRSSTIFGSPNEFLQPIAAQNGMVSFFDNVGLNMGKLQSASSTPDLVYGPPLAPGQQPRASDGAIDRRLIGTPQQTDYGVNFRVLLDPRLRTRLPPMVVKLDQAIIRQQPLQTFTNSSILTQDGSYIVAGVRHFGDSRGTEWYSEVTGIAAPQNLLAMIPTGGSNASQ